MRLFPKLPSRSAPSPAPRRALLAALATSLALSGCSAISRVGSIGEQPELSPITDPLAAPGYKPVTLPMPAPQQVERQPNSIWRAGSRGFFKDLRATHVGDILTVVIAVNDSGTISDATTRARTNSDTANITNLFGFQNQFKNFFPGSIQNSLPNIYNTDSKLSNVGSGSVTRTEAVNLRLAALISQILPNGNMVLVGHQEVRLNFEIRDLQLQGVIRPEDISPANTISYDQIAEARISYGGRGQISDVQQPRYGSQLLDILLPF